MDWKNANYSTGMMSLRPVLTPQNEWAQRNHYSRPEFVPMKCPEPNRHKYRVGPELVLTACVPEQPESQEAGGHADCYLRLRVLSHSPGGPACDCNGRPAALQSHTAAVQRLAPRVSGRVAQGGGTQEGRGGATEDPRGGL